MEFNKRKFNIVVVFTVCLICLVVVFASVDFSAVSDSDSISNTTADSEEEIVQETEEDVIVEEVKTDKVPSISAKTQWQCLNYAANLLSKTNYKLTWTQSINAVAKIGGIEVKQAISKTVFKAGDKSYTKLTSSGYGEYNFTDYGYVSAETSVIINRNKSSNNVYNYNNYISEFGFTPAQLPYVLNQSTCKITKILNDAMVDYYTLEVTINEKGYENYLKSIGKTAGEGSNPKINSLNLSIKISKEYGRITSIVAREKYEISVMGGASCDSTVRIAISYGNYSNTAGVSEIKSVLGVA